MNSALSAFLNSQINAISGNALRTLDLSFGMDNTMLGSGQMHTDYSFKFAKRFWNNRLRIVIGGKVSSGAGCKERKCEYGKYILVWFHRLSFIIILLLWQVVSALWCRQGTCR